MFCPPIAGLPIDGRNVGACEIVCGNVTIQCKCLKKKKTAVFSLDVSGMDRNSDLEWLLL